MRIYKVIIWRKMLWSSIKFPQELLKEMCGGHHREFVCGYLSWRVKWDAPNNMRPVGLAGHGVGNWKFPATGKSFQSNVQQFPPLQDCKLLWNIPRLNTRRMKENYLKMEHHNPCFFLLLHHLDARFGRGLVQCNIGLQLSKIVA